MLQQEQPEDFVIATGIQFSVRQFVIAAADELGLTLRWEGSGVGEKGIIVSDKDNNLRAGQVVVQVDPRYFRPTEVETLLGDPAKAHAKLGWKPRITFGELVAEMMRSDFDLARRDSLIRQHGFKAMDYNE